MLKQMAGLMINFSFVCDRYWLLLLVVAILGSSVPDALQSQLLLVNLYNQNGGEGKLTGVEASKY